MIDFHSYEQVKLEDVAEYGRAKKGHIYPAGASTLQISASRGQIGFLHTNSEVASKDVVIIPQAGINPKYFNFILEKNIDKFMHKYATGINVQESEVGRFPIELHNKDTQDAVVQMLNFVSDEEQQVSDEIYALKKLKDKAMDSMMV